MAKTRVLITVTAYPLPSRFHDELVCTAGILEDGSWVRIYPVPFQFLEFRKYQWVDLDAQDPARDFRPESRRHHRARHTNPFTIIGVFYPPRVRQGGLFVNGVTAVAQQTPSIQPSLPATARSCNVSGGLK